MRIVTLLPSATEIVCLLGLREQLVGVSHECDYPADVRDLPRVTSALIPAHATSRQIDEQVRQQRRELQPLYALDAKLLESLRPDMIVTQNLCSVCAVSADDLQQALQRLPGSPRVLTLEPTTLQGVIDSIRDVARAADCEGEGQWQIAELLARVAAVAERTGERVRSTAVFLEWLDPPFSAGHWVPELVELAGARELIGRPGETSRTIDWQQVAAADPDVLILACCGYSAAKTRSDWESVCAREDVRMLRAVRAGRVIILDGNAYFSRPGPRLVEGLEVLAAALS